MKAPALGVQIRRQPAQVIARLLLISRRAEPFLALEAEGLVIRMSDPPDQDGADAFGWAAAFTQVAPEPGRSRGRPIAQRDLSGRSPAGITAPIRWE